MRRSTLPGLVALAVGVVGVQLLTAAVGKPFYLTQLIMTAYYTVVALSLCLVMGYAGQVSIGHAAFFGIGGYASAILTTLKVATAPSPPWVQRLQTWYVLAPRQDLFTGEAYVSFSPWIGFLGALVLAALAALVIGYPSLRLKGHYLAMATLGFGLIVYRIVLGSDVTGRADGIAQVPPWQILPGVVIGGAARHRVVNYYVAWAFLAVVLMLLLNIVQSRVGRALRAIHDAETAANAMGVNTSRLRLKTFVASAILAAAAGSLLTHYTGGIGPSETGVMKSVRYVVLVAAGGMASLWGTLVVSSILTFLSLRGCFGSYDHAVFGVILIVILTLAPNGPLKPLQQAAQAAWSRLARWLGKRQPEEVPAAGRGMP